MNRIITISLGLVFCFLSIQAKAEHFPVGTEVLANCHGFFAKGKIKRLYKEKFVVNFYKESRPLHCPPFAWDGMFLVAYQTKAHHAGKVTPKGEYFAKEESFRVGDTLEIYYKASSRGQFFDTKYTVTVKIKEISANGAAQLDITGGELKAQQVFNRWVGNNYVSLDFSSTLVADRLTILNVEKTSADSSGAAVK